MSKAIESIDKSVELDQIIAYPGHLVVDWMSEGEAMEATGSLIQTPETAKAYNTTYRLRVLKLGPDVKIDAKPGDWIYARYFTSIPHIKLNGKMVAVVRETDAQGGVRWSE